MFGIGVLLAATVLAEPGEEVLSQLPLTYVLDYGPAHINSPEYIAKIAKAPLGWCDVDGRKPGSSAPVATNAPRVCRIPKDSVTRSDGVKIKFEAEDPDRDPAKAVMRRFAAVGLPTYVILRPAPAGGPSN